ncbi:hypothetical protein OC844_000819 [Tilletia horrida]|nr:hypothetical protein OC844_000819 [Tilletia horrida]
MSSNLFLIVGAGPSAGVSAAIASARAPAAVGVAASTSRMLSSSSAASSPSGSNKARRAHERSLRSAIELYHLAPSFFPTPAQTAGFGAASLPPQPEEKAHERALDSAIRSSIQILTDAEQRPLGENSRPVLALRPSELLEDLERSSSLKDGRAAGGPTYDPDQPAPLSALTTPGLGGTSLQDDRVGPAAEKAIERMIPMDTRSASAASSRADPGFSSSSTFSLQQDMRSRLRFTSTRHPTTKEGANQDALQVRAHHEAQRKASANMMRFYDPISRSNTAPPKRTSANMEAPAAVLQALDQANLTAPSGSSRSGSGSSSSQSRVPGARGTSQTARADRLDERSARVRDALFGTVAAELPGLEVLQERRRLRQLRDQELV